jgi:hypothetical protein
MHWRPLLPIAKSQKSVLSGVERIASWLNDPVSRFRFDSLGSPSLSATLAAVPSMSLVPLVPFRFPVSLSYSQAGREKRKIFYDY